jgi:hypothetical protein
VGVIRRDDGVLKLGFQIGRVGKLLFGVVRGLSTDIELANPMNKNQKPAPSLKNTLDVRGDQIKVGGPITPQMFTERKPDSSKSPATNTPPAKKG